MTATYKARFTDGGGTLPAEIHNDGRELTISLRGVTFAGPDFDSLSPVPGHLALARELFTLQRDDLCSCRLEWTMPLQLKHDGNPYQGRLHATLDLGDPTPRGGLTSQTLALELETRSGVLRSSGRSGWFEDELLDLARQLGPGESICACITCAFSDYHPAGHGLFGGLACFRDARDAYARVRGKDGIFDLWDRMTELVQETHLCDQHLPRLPGTGYRG